MKKFYVFCFYTRNNERNKNKLLFWHVENIKRREVTYCVSEKSFWWILFLKRFSINSIKVKKNFFRVKKKHLKVFIFIFHWFFTIFCSPFCDVLKNFFVVENFIGITWAPSRKNFFQLEQVFLNKKKSF